MSNERKTSLVKWYPPIAKKLEEKQNIGINVNFEVNYHIGIYLGVPAAEIVKYRREKK